MRSIKFSLFGLIFGLCLSAVMVPLSMEDLVVESDAVVLGHCIDKRVYQEGKMIWTEYTIQVYEVLKGEKLKEVRVRQPGGELGDVGIAVSGAVSFAPFEEVLLFLSKEEKGARDLIGFGQGKFKIYYDKKTGKKFAHQQLEGIKFIESGKKEKPKEKAISKIELEQLKEEIKVLVKQNQPSNK